MTARRFAVVAITGAVLTLVALPTARTAADEAGFVRLKPDELRWREEPNFGGLKLAVVDGDPSKAGVYVIRVRFPPGVMTRPHRHHEDRLVTVISGTWYAGTGSTFDPDATVPMPPGSFMKHPAGAAHFDGAKSEAAVVQIVGVGPSDTVFVHPDDGPTGPSLTRH